MSEYDENETRDGLNVTANAQIIDWLVKHLTLSLLINSDYATSISIMSNSAIKINISNYVNCLDLTSDMSMDAISLLDLSQSV